MYLSRLPGLKNGRMLRSVKNPNPTDPEKALGPLVIEEAIAKDGGNYTCVINVVLRAVLEYNVSDITPVSGKSYWISPWPKTEYNMKNHT